MVIKTPDRVVSDNIKKLRDDRNLSRSALAGLLSDNTGTEWSRWRIIDLEGARTADQVPRPATWSEIVALAIVFDVTVFDLVLPDTETAVVVSTHDEPFRIGAKDRNAKLLTNLSREGLAATLFRLPEKYLSVEYLDANGGADLGHILSLYELQRDRKEAADTIKRTNQRIVEIFSDLDADARTELRELAKDSPGTLIGFTLDDEDENPPLIDIYTPEEDD
jgi:hypothetical protein